MTDRGRKSLALMLLCTSCLGGDPVDYGDPTRPSDPNALFLRVETPENYQEVTTPTVEVRGTATAGSGIPVVTVSVGNSEPFPVNVVGGEFSTQVSLRHVGNTVRVVASLPSGPRSEVTRSVSYRGQDPGIVWLSPGGVQPLGGTMASVAVSASGGEREVITQVTFDAGAGVAMATFDGTWKANVALPAGASQVTIKATATATDARTTEITRTFTRDLNAPSIAITSPATGTTSTVSSIQLTGTASDDTGVDRVLVRVGDAEPEAASGTTSWTAQVFLDPGTHTVTATAVDISGQQAETSITVHVPRLISLRAPQQTGDLTLTLDVNDLKRLIPEADQKSLTLLFVDLEPLLISGLEAIKNPQAAGIDTSGWGQAERNMQRLLLMAPDNADLSGTSLEEVLSLAPNLGLPPARLLADIAGVAVDEPFLSSGDVAGAIRRTLIETHPNVAVDPADGKKKVKATLFDALNNFSTLAPNFGPVGNHPGFLTGSTFAVALNPNFAMTVTAKSNLTPHEGVVPGKGKGYLFVLRDPTRSSVLDFDFLDAERFKVEGIADEPTVDMTFFMGEHDGFVAGGTSQTARPDGGFFKGGSAAWDLDPWVIEYMVIDAVYTAKRDRFEQSSFMKVFQYDVGELMPAAMVTWDKGWITMQTAGGLGNPPAPAYFWDHLLEAAQMRLHDGVAEGQGRVQFELTRIPLGLSGEELREKLRPQMEAQKDELSRILLGDRSTYSSEVAFYRAKGADGLDYLYFTAANDIPGAMPYPFTTPGFFSNAALTQKASSTGAGTSGDSVHEKVQLTGPATYFIKAADNKTYRVEIVEVTTLEARVRITEEGT